MSGLRKIKIKFIIVLIMIMLSVTAMRGILFPDIKRPINQNDGQSPINDPYGPPSFSKVPNNIDINKRLAIEFKGQIEYYKGISALEESKSADYYSHYVACAEDERTKAADFYKTCIDIKAYLKEDELSNSLLDRLPYATRLYIRYKNSEIRKIYADNKIKYYTHMLSNIIPPERGQASKADLGNPLEGKDRDIRNDRIQK